MHHLPSLELRPSLVTTSTALQPPISTSTITGQYIQHVEIQPASAKAAMAIEGNVATTAAAAVPTVQLLTANEIMLIEMLYQSYTLKFGYSVGDSEILSDCSFVEQTLGVMVGGGDDTNIPRLAPFSPTSHATTMRRRRRREEIIEELANNDESLMQQQQQQRQPIQELQQSTTTLTPTWQPSKSMVGRPVVTIRFNMTFTTKYSDKYNITNYPIQFKRHVSNNLTQVTMDMNNFDLLHTIVNVMDVKLLNSEKDITARTNTSSIESNYYPSVMPSSITQPPSIDNIVEQVELNKSFIIGGIIGTALALVIAIATIIHIKAWRRTIQSEINNQDHSKWSRKQQLQAAANSIVTVTNNGSNGGVVGGCTTTATSTTAVMVELTNTNITSRIDEAIAGGDGNKSLLPIQSILPHHLMAENLQQSSVHCLPMMNTGSSVVVDDLSSARTINVNDSTNDQFYANNLISIPFRDDEDSDNAIVPIQLQRLIIVDLVPLHHSDVDDVTSSIAIGGESEMDRYNARDGHLPPLSHMLNNDASFSSGASDENSDNDNDKIYIDGRSFVEHDELDNYKNQDLEILRTAIEQSVKNVDMLISLAITYAYTTSTTMSTCLGWFGDEEHHSRIEASCLCDTYDWLKTNELSTMDSVNEYFSELLKRLVITVMLRILPPHQGANIVHSCATILGLVLLKKPADTTLVIHGMRKTNTLKQGYNFIVKAFKRFGEIEEAAIAPNNHGFGLIRFSRPESLKLALVEYNQSEIDIQDVSVTIKTLKSERFIS